MRPTTTAGPSATGREFSAETISELLRALHARASGHPDSPGLIASWPGVPEDRMAVACEELRRQGHAVHRVSIQDARRGTRRRGWAVGGTTYRPALTPAPPEALACDDAVIVRALAEPRAVPSTRALLRRNLLIYGLGGLIAPFVGIKLIDIVVHGVLGA